MTEQVEEVAQVGATLELEADTLYTLLSTLTNKRIYYKQPGGLTLWLSAEMSSGDADETKMLATLTSDLNINSGKMRVWGEARGTGTIIFKGRRRFILVEDPEHS